VTHRGRPLPTLFPYTTLFRSEDQVGGLWEVVDGAIVGDQDPPGHGGFLVTDGEYSDFELALETMLDNPIDSGIFLRVGEDGKSRSEEHTSELQSRENLVCRLL